MDKFFGVLFLIGLLLFAGCIQSKTEQKQSEKISETSDNISIENKESPKPTEQQISTCLDGTEILSCSDMKPKWCNANLELVNNVDQCGCPEGFEIVGNECNEIKYCSDGTRYNECSNNKPKYCDEGKLIDNASLCGCPKGYILDWMTDLCVLYIDKCSDGTPYGECSSNNKPKYCSEGKLIDDAQKCGCPAGKVVYEQTCVISDILEINGGESVQAHGLSFNIKLEAFGSEIEYRDREGGWDTGRAGKGEIALRFFITVQSLDGAKSFYYTSFSLLDKEGIGYESHCPTDIWGLQCKNKQIESMYSPIPGQKTEGELIFEVPEDISEVYLYYNFGYVSENPKRLKFVFNIK